MVMCCSPLCDTLWMVVPKACSACPTVPLKVMKVELFATPVMVKP